MNGLFSLMCIELKFLTGEIEQDSSSSVSSDTLRSSTVISATSFLISKNTKYKYKLQYLFINLFNYGDLNLYLFNIHPNWCY